MSISDCRLVNLPCIKDPRGNLTFVESNRIIPFNIQRVYYLHDIPYGSERGGHAHKDLSQLIVAVSGSFDIRIDDGHSSSLITLNNPTVGLYICPMIWREINNFSSGSVCMVLASSLYDEEDYYRDYHEFITAVKKVKK